MELDRVGWVAGEVNFREHSQLRHVAIYHSEANVGFWVEADSDEEVVRKAQYRIDEILLLRRIQLDDVIQQDDLNDTVQLCNNS